MKEKSEKQIKDIKDDMEFEVMPRQDEAGPASSSLPEQSLHVPVFAEAKSSNHKVRVWVISISLIVLILAGGFLAYKAFFLNQNGAAKPRLSAPVSEIEAVDSDQDGLSDRRESELGTDPSDPDTDKDGIADGDELNVYATDPLLPDSDLDTFDDGDELARRFNPAVNTTESATESQQAAWAAAIARFGLHEPTKTTIKASREEASETEDEGEYQSELFGYSVAIPSQLAVRESVDATIVGFFVKGAVPPDENVGGDIITISVAVKPAEQSSEEWASAFLIEGENFERKELVGNGGAAGTLYKNITGQSTDCPIDQAHFSKENDSKVFAVTLACNELSDFTALFNEIVSSFKLPN